MSPGRSLSVTLCFPASTIIRVFSGLARIHCTARAMDPGLPGSHRNPVTRSSTSSGTPSTAGAITGLPLIIPSIADIGTPSLRLARTAISQAWNCSRTSVADLAPQEGDA